MDLSEFFKSGFQSLHKQTLEKNYQQKTLKARMEDFSYIRRQTRDTLLLQKRNLDLNMSPYVTPQPTRLKKATVNAESTKTNPVNSQSKPKKVGTASVKRLEMLKKWKEDKEKRLQEEKKKAKPIFKVCHISNDKGTSNFEKVKPSKPQEKFVSKFAPKDHKFQAPKNIKPINIGGLESLSVKHSKNNFSPRRDLSNKFIETRQKTEEPKTNRGKSKATTLLSQKDGLRSKSLRMPLSRDNNGLGNNQGPQVNKVNASKKIQKSDVKSSDKTKKLANNQVPQVNRDNVINVTKKIVKGDAETSDKTKKVTTNKTKKLSSDKTKEVTTDKTKQKTNGKTKKLAVGFAENLPNNDDETIPAKKKYQMTPRKRKNERNRTNSDDTLSVSDEMLKTPNKNIKTSKTKIEKEVAYSDEEISLKTPIKKQLRSSYKPRSELKELRGSGRSKTKKTETSSESELADVVTKNQVFTENTTFTPDDCELNPQNPTESDHTPKNTRKSTHRKEQTSPVNYISPFVTISRGKDSARKEFKVRQSTGGTFTDTPESKQDFSARTSPKMGAEYFTKTLDIEVDRIESICEEWKKYKENEIPEEAINLIDVAVGQSKLLIDKKFKQFRSLIEECRSCQYKEKPITCTDLHGFWDMVYMQVGDLDKRFANLEALKVNDWKEVVTEKIVTAPKRTRGRPKKVAASSSLRDAIRAARNKKKHEEAPVEIPQIAPTTSPSPIQGPSALNHPSSLRRSLRVSLLNGQTVYNSRRASSSPGLTMMKVTQAIKTGDGITPSRSILKSTLTKSEKCIKKSVLFKDDLEEDVHDDEEFSGVSNEVDKENNASSLNSLIFSPVTPTRRSQRLSKKS